jgi:nitrate reductase gamma subunit
MRYTLTATILSDSSGLVSLSPFVAVTQSTPDGIDDVAIQAFSLLFGLAALVAWLVWATAFWIRRAFRSDFRK